FGFDSGVINGTVDALKTAFNASSFGSGFNVASMLLGCAVGAFIAGNLADKFGRKSVMIVTAFMFTVSAWGSGIAHSAPEFIAYRVLGGFAIGAASVICPAYISEIAPAAIRGSLSSLQQLAIVLGLFVAFLSNFLIARASGGTATGHFWLGFEGWQWMFWVGMIPAGIFFLTLFLIPESPRYLVAAGKSEQAQRVLARLSHADDSAAKVKEIKDTLKIDHKPQMSDLYDKEQKRIHPVLWAGIGLAAFQQLIGINVVFYYGAVLWQAAGFSEDDALLINVISGAVNIGSTVLAMALIDKLGRKPLLLAGSIGMAIFLGTLAVIFSQAAVVNGVLHLTPTAGKIALVAANAYVFFFGISWGPVMWVMLGEMFQNKFRGAALAVSGFVQWITNFAITMTFPIFLAGIGLGGSYAIYAGFAVISVFFILKLVQETKGKTLEEM
ncbi:MAG TPA: sugar porter family MFS transporter, partial [Chthoniobacterales bacterium]|nr:sugar porter family MFS transporter [Chthoniobacterales bacterium]